MRRLFFFACMSLLLPFGAGAQATENPDDMFGGNMVQSAPEAGASGAAQGAPTGTQAASGGTQATSAGTQAASPAPESFLQSKGVDIGGYLYSDYTGYAIWPGSYPSFSDPASGLTSSFVPNLEADVYLDARPYSFFRVFGKLKAIYPFGGSAQGVYQAQTNPFASIYTPPSGSSAAIPNISVFELFADVNWNEKLFLRVGQQVIHWGVGTFFSPADILSLTSHQPAPAEPGAARAARPYRERALCVSGQRLCLRHREPGVRAKPSVRPQRPRGGPEGGAPAWRLRNRSRRVLSKGSKTKGNDDGNRITFRHAGNLRRRCGELRERPHFRRSLARRAGNWQAYTDTTTPYFSGTVGISYAESSQHIAAILQYYYNGQGYANLSQERGAVDLYSSQQTALGAGTQPAGPLLAPTDLLLPGQHYLARLSDLD